MNEIMELSSKRKSKATSDIFDKNYCKCNERTHEYRPKAVTENIIALLDHYNIKAKYNEMSHDTEVEIPNTTYTCDNAQEITLEWIFNKCVHHDFLDMNKNRLEAILLMIADGEKYHPAKEYLIDNHINYNASVDYIKQLADTITVKHTFKDELKHELIKTWLISCVAAVMGKKGFSSHGVLVLQGGQGIGKTSWFRNLVNDSEWFKDAIAIDPENKDSVSRAIRYWIVELGEIGSTMKKEIDMLKAFITNDKDVFRKAYGRKESSYPRRTIFCGTVNAEQFLKDDTGNRRWWTIPCEAINYDHDIDMNAVWAQVYELYKNGADAYLNSDIQAQLDECNKSHEMMDNIDTLIESAFDWSKDARYWLKPSDVFNELGKPNNVSTTKIKRSLQKLGIKEKSGRSRVVLFLLPKTSSDENWTYEEETIEADTSGSRQKATQEETKLFQS